jgi:hypothetical protein
MCLMAIGLVAGIAGSAVSAMGAMQQADAQAKSMEYNATVAKINARTERQKGAAEQEKIGIKYDRAEGTGIANAAKGGVDPTYGSAALTIFGTNWQDRQMDQGTAYTNAESAAVGNENKAKDLEAQAAATRKAGKIAAAGSFLSGIAGAAKGFSGGGGSSLMINA